MTRRETPIPYGESLPALPSDWQERLEKVQLLVEEYAVADNTRRSYNSAWAGWIAWCAREGICPLPASPLAIVLFLEEKAEEGWQVSSFQQSVSAIRFHHTLAKYDPPPTDSAEVVQTVRSLRRKLGVAPKNAKRAIRLDHLRRIVEVLPKGPAGKRDKALLLAGFICALRRSELVALEVDDIAWVPEGMEVTIRSSKTDQEGAGAVLGVHRAEEKGLCPVQAMRDWMAAAEITSGPIFLTVDRWGHIRRGDDQQLHPSDVARKLKKYLRKAGFTEEEAKDYSGHSLRAGFATEAASRGVEERLIAVQTRHKDMRTLRRYIREGTRFSRNPTKGLL